MKLWQVFIWLCIALIISNFFVSASEKTIEREIENFPSDLLIFKWGLTDAQFSYKFSGWNLNYYDSVAQYGMFIRFLSFDVDIWHHFYVDESIYPEPKAFLDKSKWKLHALGYSFHLFEDEQKLLERYEDIESFLIKKYGKPVYTFTGNGKYIENELIYTPRYWGIKLKRISVWHLPGSVEMHHYLEYYYYTHFENIKFYSPKFKELESVWIKYIEERF